MSYDLFVFAADQAPKARDEFLDWYDAQTEWDDDEADYDDPKRTTPALQAWFMAMIQTFPPLNGPFSRDDQEDGADESRASDYGIGSGGIYVGFAWSLAEEAHETVRHLAAKHGVGFFDVSSDKAAVWLPDGQGGLVHLHEGSDADEA